MPWRPHGNSPGRRKPSRPSVWAPRVNDNDFSYVAPEDVSFSPPYNDEPQWRRRYPSSRIGARRYGSSGTSVDVEDELEPDLIRLRHLGKSYSLRFPPYSIGDGLVTVGDVKTAAATVLGVARVQFIRLLYKGRLLTTDDLPAKDVGLKQHSQTMVVVSDDEDSESDVSVAGATAGWDDEEEEESFSPPGRFPRDTRMDNGRSSGSRLPQRSPRMQRPRSNSQRPDTRQRRRSSSHEQHVRPTIDPASLDRLRRRDREAMQDFPQSRSQGSGRWRRRSSLRELHKQEADPRDLSPRRDTEEFQEQQFQEPQPQPQAESYARSPTLSHNTSTQDSPSVSSSAFSHVEPSRPPPAAEPNPHAGKGDWAKLDALKTEFQNTCESKVLAFIKQPPRNSGERQKEYAKYYEALLAINQKIDGLQAHGDEAFRNKRREFIRHVQGIEGQLDRVPGIKSQ